MQEPKYVIILLMILLFVGFFVLFSWRWYILKTKRNKELFLFRQINLTINNKFKELFYKHNKIVNKYNILIFLSFLFDFAAFLFLEIVLCWKLSKKYLDLPTINIVLIYLIPTLAYLIFVGVHFQFYIKKNFIKDKKPLSKDFEIIKSYFDKLKTARNITNYNFELIDDKQNFPNVQVKKIKQFVIKKINKLKLKKVDDNYITLYVLTLLCIKVIDEIKISNINIYENKKIINNESNFNYELFFLKYILERVNSSNQD